MKNDDKPENEKSNGDAGFTCAYCGRFAKIGEWHVCGPHESNLGLSTDARIAGYLERIALALETIVQQQTEQALVEAAQTTKAGPFSSKNPRPIKPTRTRTTE